MPPKAVNRAPARVAQSAGSQRSGTGQTAGSNSGRGKVATADPKKREVQKLLDEVDSILQNVKVCAVELPTIWILIPTFPPVFFRRPRTRATQTPEAGRRRRVGLRRRIETPQLDEPFGKPRVTVYNHLHGSLVSDGRCVRLEDSTNMSLDMCASRKAWRGYRR